MKNLRKFNELNESDISSYETPKNIIKIPDGDTGYELIKKSYHRWIWTWNQYANK